MYDLCPIPEILYLRVIVKLPLFGMPPVLFLADKYQVVRSDVASEGVQIILPIYLVKSDKLTVNRHLLINLTIQRSPLL